MTTESEIRSSLSALLGAIKASNGTVVASEMARLEDIVAREGAKLPAQLAHFLERRSYAKALMFLGGETDIPAGACGGQKS